MTITRLFRPRSPRQGAQALGLALVLTAVGASAQATPSYTVLVTANADLGKVTSAPSGDTVFTIDPTAGAVTNSNGGGATRSSNGAVRAMVTVSCTGVAGDCSKNVNVKLVPTTSPIGRGRALLRPTFIMGSAQLAGLPGAPGSGAFTIAPIGLNSSKTFFVGADFGIAGDDSGLPTGLAEADLTVETAEAPVSPVTGPIARFTATILRSLSITKTADLTFGIVSPPASGTGTVTVDPTTGVRTTVGATGFGTPTPTQAAFSVTGEGGQAITVTIPASFVMSGPQPMTVTTSASFSGSPLLSGALGSQGSFNFGVGGTIPVDSTTPNGSYTGNFTVTVAYN